MLITLCPLFANLLKLPIDSRVSGYLCAYDNSCAGIVADLKLFCYGEKEKAKENFYSGHQRVTA
jgi:hypothetical protein